MYQIIANSTGNVLWIIGKLGSRPSRFFSEEEARAYLEERYTKSGLSLWTVEEV